LDLNIRAKREKQSDGNTNAKVDMKETAPDKQQEEFKRATSVCLDARGYSVR
jgi:hypothetical protein